VGGACSVHLSTNFWIERSTFHQQLHSQSTLIFQNSCLKSLTHSVVRNRHLSKSILDAGWDYLKQRLADKAVEAGRQVVLVNPSYTSKTCSSCGVLFEGLALADRWIACSCGLSMDRDVNAALNILRVGQTHWGKSTDNSLGLPQEAPPL
jgi:putative transposase